VSEKWDIGPTVQKAPGGPGGLQPGTEEAAVLEVPARRTVLAPNLPFGCVCVCVCVWRGRVPHWTRACGLLPLCVWSGPRTTEAACGKSTREIAPLSPWSGMVSRQHVHTSTGLQVKGYEFSRMPLAPGPLQDSAPGRGGWWVADSSPNRNLVLVARAHLLVALSGVSVIELDKAAKVFPAGVPLACNERLSCLAHVLRRSVVIGRELPGAVGMRPYDDDYTLLTTARLARTSNNGITIYIPLRRRRP
jgi:hypothetical protein